MAIKTERERERERDRETETERGTAIPLGPYYKIELLVYSRQIDQ